MSEINVGRFNRVLQRLLQLKGDAPAPELAGELVPGIVLENDRPENAYLGGDRLCIGYAAQGAGGAGNRGQITFNNPTGSGVLCIIDQIWVATGAAGVITMRVNVGLGGFTLQTGTVFCRDRRWGTQVPTCQISAKNNTALVAGSICGLIPGQATTGAGTAQHARVTNLGIVMPPEQTGFTNSRITLDPGNDNQDITVTFLWRERAMEASEA